MRRRDDGIKGMTGEVEGESGYGRCFNSIAKYCKACQIFLQKVLNQPIYIIYNNCSITVL